MSKQQQDEQTNNNEAVVSEAKMLSKEETASPVQTPKESSKKTATPVEPVKESSPTKKEETHSDVVKEPSMDAEKVKKQLKDAGSEIEALKQELALADVKKEKAFKKKQEVGSKIAEKIKFINECKTGRNSLTQEVRTLKKDRDELNKKINERVQEIKKLTGGKPLPRMREGKDGEGPGALKKQIEALEYKLETQPMGFEAERKINKEVKEIKKKLDAKMGAFKGMEDVLAKSKEIDALKKEANDLHAKVTKLANDSQKRHEDLIENSKEIETLKKEEEELYNIFLEYKKLHAEVSAKLKNKMGVETQAHTIIKKERTNAKKEKEAADKKTLKERAREAEEKVKKKQKLTTEDLLAMQGMK